MNDNYSDVFLIGTGDLGGWIVEILSRLPGMQYKKIILGAYHEESARKRTYSSWAGTSIFNMSPEMDSVKINLLNIDEAGEVLRKYNPKVIVNSTSLQSYWIGNVLSKELWSKMKIKTGIGPWLPIYLILTHNLMQAIKKYNIKSHVVNASYPDLVNPVLGKIGLEPTCGIGDGGLLVPGIRRCIAKKLNISPRIITIYLVAHHSHMKQFMILDKPGAPYYLKVMIGDKDMTYQFNPDDLILSGLKDFSSYSSNTLAASSASSVIWHLLFDSGEINPCVPGPNGEIGGYPTRITPKSAEIELPEDISMKEAREINQDAQKNDGIEMIKNDGTVVFTEQAYQSMKKIIGYDCKALKISESKERYEELLTKYNEVKKRHNIN